MNAPHCPVCNSTKALGFLRRPQVPVHQNLLVASAAAARAVSRGDLDMTVCQACGFVWNRAFDASLLQYGEDYDNTQSCSAYFDDYLNGLVRDMVERQGVRDCTVVEVGCGKGHFLEKLVRYPGANIVGYGFDPSYDGPDQRLGGRLQFRRCYYDETCTDVPADVVVCRHVIEHVPNPLQLLGAVRRALEGSPRARVFFETPCVDWILRHQVVWDFFYEHCSLFTAQTLGLAFRRAGFAVQRVQAIFGEQYLWLEAAVASNVDTATQPTDTPELARRYGEQEREQSRRWTQRLQSLHARGPLALWGAGAKGATFANLADPLGQWIDCVADLNPNKQGRFLPGTGHPIVAPAELPGRDVRHAILMNPNYRQENLDLLARNGIPLTLIDWND